MQDCIRMGASRCFRLEVADWDSWITRYEQAEDGGESMSFFDR